MLGSMWLTEVIISVSASACESSRASRVSSDEETVCGYCAVAPPGGWVACVELSQHVCPSLRGSVAAFGDPTTWPDVQVQTA
jgi:hypothetical protein